jgi:hypothetical protein
MVSRGSTASAFLVIHSAMVQASVTFRAAEIDRESADICQDGIGATLAITVAVILAARAIGRRRRK